MRTSYFKGIAGLFILVFAFCSIAEAGAGATKAYKLSVTIPATFQVQAKAQELSQASRKTMQIAMEKDIRNNEMVMVKTVVSK